MNDLQFNMSAVAAFVAARLQYPMPPCNSSKTRVSTISVQQHKTKFGEVRIYCTLADVEQVRLAWNEVFTTTMERGMNPIISAEFIDRWLIHDGEHYRRCYLDMLEIIPSCYARCLRSGADHDELLFDKAGLDTWLAGISPEVLTFYCKKWNVVDLDTLRAKLYKICWFR